MAEASPCSNGSFPIWLLREGAEVFSLRWRSRFFLRASGVGKPPRIEWPPPVERILVRCSLADEQRGVLANPGGRKFIILYETISYEF